MLQASSLSLAIWINKETKQALTHSLVTNKPPGHTPDGLTQTGTSRKKIAGGGFPFLPDAQLKG